MKPKITLDVEKLVLIVIIKFYALEYWSPFKGLMTKRPYGYKLMDSNMASNQAFYCTSHKMGTNEWKT